MATGRSLPNPPDEYGKVEEKAFRGNLQLSLDELSSKIASLEGPQRSRGQDDADGFAVRRPIGCARVERWRPGF